MDGLPKGASSARSLFARCSPPRHRAVTARLHLLLTLPRMTSTVPGGNTQMRRTFVRRCGLVLAALALPVLMIGTAASATTPSAAKLASAPLNGDGSTFQLGFNQVVIGSF